MPKRSKRAKWEDNEAGGSTRPGFEDFSVPGPSMGKKNKPRPPPGLTGKEIGLFYRDLKRQKNKDKHERNMQKHAKKIEKQTLPIKLSPEVEERISNLIKNSENMFIAPNDNNSAQNSSNSFENKYNHISDSLFKRKFLNTISGNLQDNIQRALYNNDTKLKRDERLDKILFDDLMLLKNSYKYRNMLQFRERLPVFEKKTEILDAIDNTQVLVISGETGSGKTTQVAQFILDDQIQRGYGSVTNIICTQPRRISAISVAERVAEERGEKIGHSVGYQIRLERILPRPVGSISFCTTAVLLKCMQSDPALQNYSCIIIDEIHERNTHTDFLMALLKQIIPKRPDLKLILMSATLNSDQFAEYFSTSHFKCPIMHIPGFIYPVQEFYLEDVLSLINFQFSDQQNNKRGGFKKLQKKYDAFDNFVGPFVRHLEGLGTYSNSVLKELRNPKSEELCPELICELVKYISLHKPQGAILVFLPGMTDISKVNRIMIESKQFPQNRFSIFPLHSRMPTVDQKLIFSRPPPGIRKVIIATNIAETSITIEDVVYVIDSGKIKLSKFDASNNIETLEPEWVTEANRKQRKGRAGRVQPGICYYLYTKLRSDSFDKYPVPEMLRTRLEEVILQVKILQLGSIHDCLSTVMNPPDARAINLSVDLLKKLNALDQNENLTPLGYHLAQLPLDPRTGKMIIWAAMFSCVEPIFAIAASLSFKDAFYCPIGMEQQAQVKKLELGMNQFSDHIALAEALKRFEQLQHSRHAYQFCREYFLSFNTLKLLSDMKKQFANYLYEMRFMDSSDPSDPRWNVNSNNKALIKAIVAAGLYPNIAIIKKANKHSVTAITLEKEKVKVHPSSINEKVSEFPSQYLTYFLKRKTSAIYLLDSTCVNPMALIFASPTSAIGQKGGKCIISVSDALSFFCDPRTAQLVQDLSERLNNILEWKISHPGSINWNAKEGQILRAIVELVSQSDQNLGFQASGDPHQSYHSWNNWDEDSFSFDD